MLDRASKLLNHMEQKYLVTQHNIDDFNYHYLYDFYIFDTNQIKRAKKLHQKIYPKLKKIFKIAGYQTKYDKNCHEYNLNDYIEDKVLIPIRKNSINRLNQNEYLISGQFFTIKEIQINDLRNLKFELKAYLAESDNMIDNIRLLLLSSKYTNSKIAKLSGVNQSIINNVRNGHQEIGNLSIFTGQKLRHFFSKTQLPMKYSDQTMNQYYNQDKMPLPLHKNQMNFKGFNDIKTQKNDFKHHKF